MDSGFHGFRSSILDSTDQNYLDSGDRITLHGATKSEFEGGARAHFPNRGW